MGGMQITKYEHILFLMLLLLQPAVVNGKNEKGHVERNSVVQQSKVYHCEFGAQGGLGYYVGDATKHIFNDIRWAAGLQFRYKFDRRWSISLKAQTQQLAYRDIFDAVEQKQMLGLDVLGEFNFFRFGFEQYDMRIKPITPYMFLGLGVGLYNDLHSVGMYFPFGFGLKWRLASGWGLNIAWQQQLWFADGLEGHERWNDPYGLNGINFLNGDYTSTITAGIVVEFIEKKRACRTCD